MTIKSEATSIVADPNIDVLPVAPGALITRLLLSAQRLAGPTRVMFDRIFLKGEPEVVVIESLGLTSQDYSQMLRTLAASTR